MADSSAAATIPAIHGPVGPGDVTKRDLLQLIAISGAVIGAGAIAWPLIDSMNPSKDVLALSSVDVDLTPVVEGPGHHHRLAGQADLRAPSHRRPRSRKRRTFR